MWLNFFVHIKKVYIFFFLKGKKIKERVKLFYYKVLMYIVKYCRKITRKLWETSTKIQYNFVVVSQKSVSLFGCFRNHLEKDQSETSENYWCLRFMKTFK